jgi:hypothetical protein
VRVAVSPEDSGQQVARPAALQPAKADDLAGADGERYAIHRCRCARPAGKTLNSSSRSNSSPGTVAWRENRSSTVRPTIHSISRVIGRSVFAAVPMDGRRAGP